jgi:hypothetical protein
MSAVTVWLWIIVGVLLSGVHMAMIGSALSRAATKPAEEAGRIIVRGLPLRLLILTPILILAAQNGLWACLGLVIGSVAGRWTICYLVERRGRRGGAL